MAAAQPQEVVGQDAAFEEGIELVLHEPRQVGSGGSFGLGEEGRGVLLHRVTNLAARLCAEATGGQVLVNRKIMARVEGLFGATEVGPRSLKGLTHPVPAFARVPSKAPAVLPASRG